MNQVVKFCFTLLTGSHLCNAAVSQNSFNRTKKILTEGIVVVICLEQGANDMHVVQSRPPSHILVYYNPAWFTFMLPAYRGCPGKKMDLVVVTQLV